MPRADAAGAPPRYRFTDLEPLGLGGIGINAIGQVTSGPYLWTPTVPNGTSGTTVDMGALGGSSTDGRDISDSGQVVGVSYLTGDATYHAFLYDGTLHDLGTLGGTLSAGDGINDSGQVTGSSTTTGGEFHAFLWTPTTPNGASGTMIDLGTFGGTTNGLGINDSGQVAGYSHTTGDETRAFLWTPTTPNGTSGTMIDLGSLGGVHSWARAINTSGQVTGNSTTTGAGDFQHAFLWTPITPNGVDGAMIDLGTLGGNFSAAIDVNARGHVIGVSNTADNPHARPFVYTSNSGMVDLATLIDPLPGWFLEHVSAINDAGQIAGYGSYFGETRAFLLSPVPEPSTTALVALGLAGLAMAIMRFGKCNGKYTMPMRNATIHSHSARQLPCEH
jgi:probable HAF family extracellular repeat protein